MSFKPNQVQLNLKGVAALDSLSSFLIKSPEHCINIIGYTDASGVEEKNIILSNKRAHAVFLYLINKKVNQNQLYFTGCGSIDPLANNKYEWGRKKNRRIEIELLKK
ncbi:MAG: OmpA family protein [Parvicellaceae bacterium]